MYLLLQFRKIIPLNSFFPSAPDNVTMNYTVFENSAAKNYEGWDKQEINSLKWGLTNVLNYAAIFQQASKQAEP